MRVSCASRLRAPALIVGLAVGCGSGAGAPPAAPKDAVRAQKAACERTADHLVGMMAPGRRDLPPDQDPTELADTIARTLVGRCTEDGWSTDALDCFGEAATLADAGACAPFLTVTQREAMDRAMEAALGPRAAPERK